jgi:two-component system invasion response regulator UvrY
MIRVLLVDDHSVVRFGFRLLLEAANDVQVVAEADSGEAACTLYPQCTPDIVILDLSMPGMGGIEALKRIRTHHRTARLLALSAHDDVMHARRALTQGALGFLSKRSAPEILLDAVRTVASGKRYLDPALAQQLALADPEGGSPLDQLSEREFEVFLRLAKGEVVQTIANDLSVSTSTIGTHLYNVKQKLGASNQAELTLIALRAGLIEV